MSIENEINEIKKVKRAGSAIIEKPYQIDPDITIVEAKIQAEKLGVSGLLVVRDKKLVGIVTSRDFVFVTDMSAPISSIMTKNPITAPIGTDIDEAKNILRKNRIEKLPVVDEYNRVYGLFVTKYIENLEKYPNASKDKKGRPMVGAAVGIRGDYMDRTEMALEAGADIIVVDVAHGHSENTLSAVRNIKKSFPDCELIAGNVVSALGTEELIRAGAAGIRVGIGSGSICITRIIAGAGVPQLTAVMDCAKIGKAYDVPIISDGGTRTSGDACKALAAGASAVMIGNMFGGTDESPGSVLMKNGKRYKMYRGMASLGASIGRTSKETGSIPEDEEMQDYVAEGVESMVPYKGPVAEVLKQLVGGVRSGLSYCGAHDIISMQDNAEFIKVLPAGQAESRPHDVSVI